MGATSCLRTAAPLLPTLSKKLDSPEVIIPIHHVVPLQASQNRLLSEGITIGMI
jgi:hypothetical protein